MSGLSLPGLNSDGSVLHPEAAVEGEAGDVDRPGTKMGGNSRALGVDDGVGAAVDERGGVVEARLTRVLAVVVNGSLMEELAAEVVKQRSAMGVGRADDDAIGGDAGASRGERARLVGDFAWQAGEVAEDEGDAFVTLLENESAGVEGVEHAGARLVVEATGQPPADRGGDVDGGRADPECADGHGRIRVLRIRAWRKSGRHVDCLKSKDRWVSEEFPWEDRSAGVSRRFCAASGRKTMDRFSRLALDFSSGVPYG